MAEAFIGYFGYGSLVNTNTLTTGYVGAFRVRLCGWRRHWQRRPLDSTGGHEIALLSVHADASSSLDGMLIIDRAENLAQIDHREARYDRHVLSQTQIEFAEAPPADLPASIYLYVGKPAKRDGVSPKLLQSYLDAVLTGYMNEFGEAGLARFIATTIGFDREIICDRDAPVYPRAVQISPELAERFDRLLREAGVRFRIG